jgi:HAD superfamily hydrolase (TIGR01509 family)
MTRRFVYFDLGNVLVTFDHRIAAAQLASAANCTLDQVLSTVFESDLQTRYETGLVTDAQYAQEVNQMLGSQLSTADVLEAISRIFQPNWPILAALERLRAADIPMGILSNTCDAHWRWLMQKDWPMLHGWFEHIVLSFRVGYMKPAKGIYEACENSCGLDGDQIFFTDDRPENIAAAAQRGWWTHLFQEIGGLERSLNQWLGASPESGA